jgi:hypothetical protein
MFDDGFDIEMSAKMCAALDAVEAEHALRTSGQGCGPAGAPPRVDALEALSNIDVAAAEKLAASVAREAEIESRKRKAQQTLDDLEAKYKGRRGSYPKADAEKKSRADAQLMHLVTGVLPEEALKAERMSLEAAAAAACTQPHVAARLAHSQSAPVGR